MSLINRLGMKSKLAAASLGIIGLTGCGTIDNDPGMGLAGLSGLMSAGANHSIQQGNLGQAQFQQGLANVYGGMSDYQRQSAIAQQGRSQVNVNVGGGQGLELVATNIINIPFNPNEAGIKLFGKMFRTNYNGKEGLAMADERYFFNRGEMMNFVVHYPQNRPVNKMYGIWARLVGNTEGIIVIDNAISIPSFITRSTKSINSAVLQPGEYEFFVVGGYSPNNVNAEAVTNVLIR